MIGAIVVSLRDLPENATMAHVAARAGAFTSVTQARKNGIDGPIALGIHQITKRVAVEVVDREVADGDFSRPDPSYRPDLDPGFWAHYVPPKGPIEDAFQYPSTDRGWADRMVSAYHRRSVLDRRERLTTARIRGMVLEGIEEGRLHHSFDMDGLHLSFTDSDVVQLMDKDDPRSFFAASRALVRRMLGSTLTEKATELKLPDLETSIDSYFSFAPSQLLMETL